MIGCQDHLTLRGRKNTVSILLYGHDSGERCLFPSAAECSSSWPHCCDAIVKNCRAVRAEHAGSASSPLLESLKLQTRDVGTSAALQEKAIGVRIVCFGYPCRPTAQRVSLRRRQDGLLHPSAAGQLQYRRCAFSAHSGEKSPHWHPGGHQYSVPALVGTTVVCASCQLDHPRQTLLSSPAAVTWH